MGPFLRSDAPVPRPQNSWPVSKASTTNTAQAQPKLAMKYGNPAWIRGRVVPGVTSQCQLSSLVSKNNPTAMMMSVNRMAAPAKKTVPAPKRSFVLMLIP